MATLQTARHVPTVSAHPRLKIVGREPSAPPAIPESTTHQAIVETVLAAPSSNHLTDLEQRQLLIQAAALFDEWQLVSVQHRSNSGVLVAYLLRNQDDCDPLQMIRDGHALQIMMDAVGNIKVQHPRRKNSHFWQRCWHNFVTLFSA